MQATLLIGPAGSGKTHRCLAEIAAELKRAPGGLPLILLAPRQATFQLERGLLADGNLAGFSRLQIVSFERLAELVLHQYAFAVPRVLGEEGRVMVLRALLDRLRSRLRLFHTSVRFPGFARELSGTISELQRHQVAARRLQDLADQLAGFVRLPDKLHDLALIIQEYEGYLGSAGVQDPGAMLDIAARQIQSAVEAGAFRVAGLWLDGFGDLTPQEINFLAAILPHCQQATLTFCLAADAQESTSPLSMWGGMSRALRRCLDRISQLPGCKVKVEAVTGGTGRFASKAPLAHLEAHWADPVAFPEGDGGTNVRLFSCQNPEAEAVAAAREILAAVRGHGLRFRDIGVLVRSLETYGPLVRRVFNRYGIPHFLDRRESIAHHPLAELTRYALRTLLYRWEPEDWFGALKTGLVCPAEHRVDDLENAALAHGWRGEAWLHPLTLPEDPSRAARLEQVREQVVPPFIDLDMRMETAGKLPTGPQLAEALRELWTSLDVKNTLEQWSREATVIGASLVRAQIHPAAFEELSRWLGELELAFTDTPLPLRDWLPIIEAGLSQLSVGVVPLALDEVLVGAVDRSRNPNLELMIVLGLNEGVFPLPPAVPVILSEPEREALAARGLPLDPDPARWVARENFYGYIACTRARERIVLTCAMRDTADAPLNPSPFLDRVTRLFPGVKIQALPIQPALGEPAHPADLLPVLLRNRLAGANASDTWKTMEQLPPFAEVLERLTQAATVRERTQLPPELTTQLYGRVLQTSVSRLEDYAACPFLFFAQSGLRAREREEFVADPRESGRLEHELLRHFHGRVAESGRRWRDLKPGEARILVRELAEAIVPAFRNGLFQSSPERRFLAETRVQRVERLMETLVRWARQYEFEPRAVELPFGEEQGLPAWKLNLGDGHELHVRGRIDRVDILPGPDPDSAYVVVIDYKASGRKLEDIQIEHGLDIQLLAYLGVLSECVSGGDHFGEVRLLPAGAFYVGVSGSPGTGADRREVLGSAEDVRGRLHQHRGRFRSDLLERFHQGHSGKGDQFKFRICKNGKLAACGNEALAADQFGELIARTRERLVRFGQQIFAGDARPYPYRLGVKTPCGFCTFKPVCRFDNWLGDYRVLGRTHEGPRENGQ